MTLADPSPPTGARRLFPLMVGASRLGISRSKMYELIAAGEIRTVKIGAKRLVDSRELDRFMDGLSDA